MGSGEPSITFARGTCHGVTGPGMQIRLQQLARRSNRRQQGIITALGRARIMALRRRASFHIIRFAHRLNRERLTK
jgi:hypothetical protein